MKKILVTEPIHESGMALLRAREDIEIIELADIRPETLITAVKGVHAIAVRGAVLTQDILEQSEDLEIVSRYGVGCDNVAVDYMTKRGLPVAIASGANSTSVAEHTMMMILATARHLLGQGVAIRKGEFRARGKLIATDLQGANILIVGFGRCGRKLAPLARAFGMNVTVVDIKLDRELANEMGCRGVEDFRPELPNADFISLHVPLDDTTRHMISDAEFTAMKPGAVLINCARGGIVDETAMIAALDGDRLAAIGTDVYEQEPPSSDHPLFGRDDVVLTPHSGAASFGSLQAMSEMTAQNIIDHFDGQLQKDCIFNTDVIPHL